MGGPIGPSWALGSWSDGWQAGSWGTRTPPPPPPPIPPKGWFRGTTRYSTRLRVPPLIDWPLWYAEIWVWVDGTLAATDGELEQWQEEQW